MPRGIGDEKPSTAFVSLYEPTRGPTRISAFERIAQTDGGVALRVRGMEGEGVDDRILPAYAENAERELTLADGRESFAFRGFAHVRVGENHVAIHGHLTRILVNGKASPAVVREVELNPTIQCRSFREDGESRRPFEFPLPSCHQMRICIIKMREGAWSSFPLFRRIAKGQRSA